MHCESRLFGFVSVTLSLALGCVAPTARAQDAPPDSTRLAATEHRWIRIAREYRRAVAEGDTARVDELQAADARLWFDEKIGPGRPLNSKGEGPWAAWDMFFRSRSQQSDFVVEGNAVRFTNVENNDWYLLVERATLPYHIFYFFDDEDRISGKLVRGIEGQEQPPDLVDEFEAWANEKHPGLIELLMPDGRFDPRLENARLWKKHLVEWRAETGRPDVLQDTRGH